MNSAQARRILGVQSGATASDVKNAFRKLALQWHPDRAVQEGIAVDKAEARFKSIQAAFELLRHDSKDGDYFRAASRADRRRQRPQQWEDDPMHGHWDHAAERARRVLA